jgi:LysR family transcriptional regulator, nitrogen assimilation regulatory protein
LNLKTLRYFLAVADEGSFTAAATAVSIAQPALTRQIRELESELGVELLLRLPRGVRLTQAGVTFYESCQKILAESRRVKLQLADKHDNSEATVVLGASPTLARVLIPGLFESCQRSVAGLHLKAREAFTPALLDWLELGVIDMAIVTNPDTGRALSLHPLLGEPFALVSSASLKIGPIVSLNQLARIPLLMTTLHRRIVGQQLAPLGGHLKVVAEIDSVDSIRELVLSGEWATLMPISVFKQPKISEDIVISEVSGVQLNRLLVLATRLGSKDIVAVPAMQKMIELEFARLTQQGVFSFTSAGVSVPLA